MSFKAMPRRRRIRRPVAAVRERHLFIFDKMPDYHQS
jgi:hypothetical protein